MLTRYPFIFLASALLLLPLLAMPPCARAQETDKQMSAVIFVYHRIGEDNDPVDNIRTDQFENQISELQQGGYAILPLPQIVAALKSGASLPPRAVALTFDGAHKSIMSAAVPLLLKDNIPFTVFIAPGQLDQNLADYISWDDVRHLSHNKLVTFGLHPASYSHLTDAPDSEILRQINAAKSRFRDMLGTEPALFAYPFGEYSLRYRDLVQQNGFTAAFGQQSGVAYPGADLFVLPRFSMTESYGDIDRFRMAADALPLPVTDIEPKDPHLDTARPDIGFTVDKDLKPQIANLSCFVTDQPRPDIHVIDTRVEIRLKQPIDDDHARINCTLPAPPYPGEDTPRWRWFGLLMTTASGMPQNVNTAN